jgi:hypothetical protein
MESTEHTVIYRNGIQFTMSPREVGMVLVQKVLDDGSLTTGELEPLYDWDLSEFVASYGQLSKMHESDVMLELQAQYWDEKAEDTREAYDDFLGWMSR